MSESNGAALLLDLYFECAMNETQIKMFNDLGLEIHGTHDPDRQVPGRGFLPGGDAPVMMTLSREGAGYRLRAISTASDPAATDDVRSWSERLLTLLAGQGIVWRGF